MTIDNLRAEFGNIDIYVFDQLLRGRIRSGMRILDAGCGGGRNLIYLLQQGCEVFGADESAAAIADVRRMAAVANPRLPADNFRVESLEAMTFGDEWADVVICSAVLHFARDDAHFDAMLGGVWRAVRPGGMLFCRLASSIGMESRVEPIGGGRYRLPDGSTRYLVDEAFLMERTETLGGQLLDPIKTTIVQDQRCMTTWVLSKA